MFRNSGIILRDKKGKQTTMAVLKIFEYRPVSAQSKTVRCLVCERVYTNKCLEYDCI